MLTFNGKYFKSIPEIIDYGLKLQADEQKRFAVAVASSNPHAINNIRYFSGYYDAETMKRIAQIFGY